MKIEVKQIKSPAPGQVNHVDLILHVKGSISKGDDIQAKSPVDKDLLLGLALQMLQAVEPDSLEVLQGDYNIQLQDERLKGESKAWFKKALSRDLDLIQEIKPKAGRTLQALQVEVLKTV